MMGTTVPFELMSGLIVVDTDINGTPQRFIVDTGASHTVLTRKAVTMLALEPGEKCGETASCAGGGGGLDATPVKVRSFTWGDIELFDITLVQVAMDNVCGLVGTRSTTGYATDDAAAS